MSGKDIPAFILKGLIEEWIRQYGSTFPLYGKETVRHDISGSVRPLLASTEIPHSKLLAERSGVSKRTITRITDGETEWVSRETAEKLIDGIARADVWYCELESYRE